MYNYLNSNKIMFKGLFCKHQWETIKELQLLDDSNRVTALGFLQKCTKCGKLNYKVFHLNGFPF